MKRARFGSASLGKAEGGTLTVPYCTRISASETSVFGVESSAFLPYDPPNSLTEIQEHDAFFLQHLFGLAKVRIDHHFYVYEVERSHGAYQGTDEATPYLMYFTDDRLISDLTVLYDRSSRG